ncbi:unnamed protein product [Eruca vesicaria subsp. sativa]|uniref:Uncharacterized protein n=1 Tax=Eruca vesicaria subsp. sativa TaxID=29727 RepID=A0ABC8KBM2_ERUVS|nr:unnamed protein product [Eruca vesicaria subsp. sativa]
MFKSSFTSLALDVHDTINDRFTKFEEKLLASQNRGLSHGPTPTAPVGATASTHTVTDDPAATFTTPGPAPASTPAPAPASTPAPSRSRAPVSSRTGGHPETGGPANAAKKSSKSKVTK